MSVFGTRVHLRRLVVVGQTEDCVGDEKTMNGTGFQQKETVAVTLAHVVFSHYSLPHHIISVDTSVKVTENDELVCPGYGRDSVLQILVESCLSPSQG